MTEQSLQAASLCLSGLDDVEKMISLAPRHSAHVAQAMPTTSKSSYISTTSSTRSSQLAGRALPDGQPGTSKVGFKMGKNVPSNAMASRVARPWHALMVAAAALSTLCAVPLSQCQHGAAVAFAKRSNGGVKGFAEEACQSCQEGRHVHHGKPGRAVLASEQVGTSIGLRGGPYMVIGMMAARQMRGAAASMKRAVIEDAKAEAKKLAHEGRTQEAIRSMIGPRGGLPTLKADLLRLAALLHVEVNEKQTVDQLRAKCRDVIKDIKLDPKKEKVGANSSSSALEPASPAKVRGVELW